MQSFQCQISPPDMDMFHQNKYPLDTILQQNHYRILGLAMPKTFVIGLKKTNKTGCFSPYSRMCMCGVKPFSGAERCGERSGYARLLPK